MIKDILMLLFTFCSFLFPVLLFTLKGNLYGLFNLAGPIVATSVTAFPGFGTAIGACFHRKILINDQKLFIHCSNGGNVQWIFVA